MGKQDNKAGSAERFWLTVTEDCDKCLKCEDHIPGFITKNKGRGLVTEGWAALVGVNLRINLAIIYCPKRCMRVTDYEEAFSNTR